MANGRTVTIVMSTYNGSAHLVRQLDSIFEQTGVQARVLIRDDHSSDATIEAIKRYKNENPGFQIDYITGENEGYARSFWDALCNAPDTDYYAFSDQDDVWMKDKLIKCILPMEEDLYRGAKLSYCKMIRSGEDLRPFEEQVSVLRPEQLNKKIVLTQTFNYGAATVFNHAAKQLICRRFPKSRLVPHDAWAGAVCYWFGKIYFVNEALYYWIRYDNSVTGEGTRLSGVRYRIKETLAGKSYQNLACDMLEGYGDLLDPEDAAFLRKLTMYKKSVNDKLALIFDRDFRRTRLAGTLMLKYGILTNRF